MYYLGLYTIAHIVAQVNVFVAKVEYPKLLQFPHLIV